MKMIFSKEKFLEDCKKMNVPASFGIEIIDGKEAIFIEGSETGTCEGLVVSKDWCEPCEEKTAREMFEALGYECDDGEYLIDYYLEISSAYGEEARKHLYFSKTRKELETYDSSIEDCVAVDRDLLNAIVKQFEELGWM